MALHSTSLKIGMSVVMFFVFCGWVVCLGGLGHVTQECRTQSSDWMIAVGAGFAAQGGPQFGWPGVDGNSGGHGDDYGDNKEDFNNYRSDQAQEEDINAAINRPGFGAAHPHNAGDMMPYPTNVVGPLEDVSYQCGMHFAFQWWMIAFEFFVIIYGFIAIFVETFHSKHAVTSMMTIGIVYFSIFAHIHAKSAFAFDGGSHSENKLGQGYKTNLAGAVILLVCQFIFVFLWSAEEEGGEPPAKVGGM